MDELARVKASAFASIESQKKETESLAASRIAIHHTA
jgi:hypothetical protein